MRTEPPSHRPEDTSRPESESISFQSLERIRAGDSSALDSLFRRHLPELRRWAHGRLPRWVRTMADTADLVQDAMLRTIRRLDRFQPRSHRVLAAYLRAAVRNQIRDEHRRFTRRGVPMPLDEQAPDAAPSPLDDAAFSQLRASYLQALGELRPSDRELIVGHVELGYSHEQLGCMTGRTTNAARVALARALEKLATRMRHE